MEKGGGRVRDIGKNIRQLREEAGLTQEELAEKLFVTRQTVSNYENGHTRPDLDMLLMIAEVLHADVTHILYGVPTPPDKKRLIRQLVIGSIASALLVAVLAVMTPIARDLAQEGFILSLLPFPQLILAPSACLALGWTLMQLSLVLGYRPPQKDWYRTAKHVLVLILGLLALVIVPYVIWQIWCTWQLLEYGSIQASFPVIPIYTHVLYSIFTITRRYTATFLICLPYGAAIRYFGFYKGEAVTDP